MGIPLDKTTFTSDDLVDALDKVLHNERCRTFLSLRVKIIEFQLLAKSAEDLKDDGSQTGTSEAEFCRVG